MTSRVGLVVVSHSAPLASAALDLALEMVAGDPPHIELAAGTEDGGVGTDATRVAAAIAAADEGVGVVVIMDLGSAVMSAEMALEFTDPSITVRLVAAPFVEGILAAAVRAAAGASLDEVATEAGRALGPKLAHLGEDTSVADSSPQQRSDAEVTARVKNAGGLHARPAAQIAGKAASFSSTITIGTDSADAVDATSPLALATLAAGPGTTVNISAAGPDAADAVAALAALIESGFGEEIVDDPELSKDPEPSADSAPSVDSAPPAAPAAPAQPLGVSPGRIVGRAVVLRGGIDEPDAARTLAPGDREAAAEAVMDACAAVAAGYRARAEHAHGQGSQVLEATAMIAEDKAVGPAAAARVRAGATSERAVWDALAEVITRYREAGGLLAARVTDLADVRDRIISRLLGTPEPGVPTGGEAFVLIATDLAPADTAILDPATCLAIVTELGSATSHTAILARDLGIPAVVGAADATLIEDGVDVLVDGTSGEVIAAPTAEQRATVTERVEPERFEGPGATADGSRVLLGANVGAPDDATTAVSWGAEGVGLFRTEFCFLRRADEPSVDEQVSQYRAVLRAFPGQRVVLRTLDAGSDKPLPFLTAAGEPNPALGVRGFRTSRAQPAVLDRQLEAIARAAAAEHADAWVMAPMIATIDEANDFVTRARGAGISTVGVMVETPSVASMADELFDVVDFVSIGTNDLAQYTMAADRLAPQLADLTDPWQPALLRQISAVAAAGRRKGKPVGVCGESAGLPDYAPVLVGLGVTSLSMSPRLIPAVAQALRSVSAEACSQAAEAAAAAPTATLARRAAGVALGLVITA